MKKSPVNDSLRTSLIEMIRLIMCVSSVSEEADWTDIYFAKSPTNIDNALVGVRASI